MTAEDPGTIDYERIAAHLGGACDRAASETEVAARIETAVAGLLAVHGVDYAPRREARVVATRRRIDSQFGAVITEYKQRLTSPGAWTEATEQLVGYLRDVAPVVADRDAHVGVVTDGRQIRFVGFEGGEPRAEHPGPLDGPRLRRYVETLVALGRRGLTQEHLVEDFATERPGAGGLGAGLAGACWAALGVATPKTGMLHTEWRRLFARSVDHHEAPAGHLAAYREALALPGDALVDAGRALFALQTGYAIVVKLVAAHVLGELRLGGAALRFDVLAAAPDGELRRFMAELEDGHLLRASGLENLLEGDFFAWYADADQWTPGLATAVRAAIARLAEYEGRAPLLRAGGLGDLFRQLYQRTIPASVRHDLGEYYTPRWLAQAVLADLPAPAGWRGLDPCCGSGTFLVELIAEVRAETAGLPAAERLRQVLDRVCGIDLNPLAVLTARVNYFLSIAGLLGELGAESGRIEIPVYLGDAAFAPIPCDLAGVPGLAYTLPTAMGSLDVALPLALARTGAAFGAVMREVERAVVAADADAACRALLRGIGEDATNAAVVDAVQHFVDALVALEARGWDRVWARILKNFLATAALDPFERVVGNPPWVEWKDLPDGYRETIRDLCRARGLFSDDGYVGGTDLNVCALIAHAALERWVVPGGHLGFLMPHQMLQVRSSQGLRRWRLPDGTPLGLQALADWSALRPFEAACKPVTYVVQRGVPGPAAVPVAVWRAKPGAAAREPGAAWRDVAPGLVRHDEAARAVDGDGGPYLIDAPEVLPRLLALLGPSAYRGRRATETSPHGVFWVRPVAGARPAGGLLLVENGLNPRARDGVVQTRALLEPELLFPLLRGADVTPFRAVPGDALVVLPHDVETGAKPLPPERMPAATLDYLRRYRDLLERRGSYKEYRAGQPFYGLWRVGPYTFAPWKVVWPELGELRAAVIGMAETPWGETKLVIPEGKVNLVPCAEEAEAHYLCALLNAPDVRRAYARMSSQIGRPSRLPFAIAAFDPQRWTHRALAAVSRDAHAGLLDGDRRERLLTRLVARALGAGALRNLNLAREPIRHPSSP